MLDDLENILKEIGRSLREIENRLEKIERRHEGADLVKAMKKRAEKEENRQKAITGGGVKLR